MKHELDFGDLSNDIAVQNKIKNYQCSVDKIAKIIELSSNSDLYEKLTTKEKVDFDLFTAYTLNTLFWLYLRTKGQDPNESEIKAQLERVKEYMLKSKTVSDKANRPKIDQAAAGRFIKHGIHYKDGTDEEEPPTKKMKVRD